MSPVVVFPVAKVVLRFVSRGVEADTFPRPIHRRQSALLSTTPLDSAIAPTANIGNSKVPVSGQITPATTGMRAVSTAKARNMFW